MPVPPGRKKKWHAMAEELWRAASRMPHCVDWRDEDWHALTTLLYEVDRYYAPTGKDATTSTAQMTEIRRQKAALGIGDQARIQLRIRYKQIVEPGLPGDGPDGVLEVLEEGGRTRPAGNVVPLNDRRKAITKRGAGAGQADIATG